MVALAVCFCSGPYLLAFASAADWSCEVDVWDPPFNSQLKRKAAVYSPLKTSKKKWRIFAFIPHFKDSYWLSVNYGLIEEAKRLGVSLIMYEAGGYENLSIQREQIERCIEFEKPDGLIIGAISDTGLNDIVQEAVGRGIPVVDLANTINSPYISSRVAPSFQNMGFLIGDYLSKLQKKKGHRLSVAWFPGPVGAGWVELGVMGFQSAIKGKPISLVATKYGDTGHYVQRPLIKDVLDRNKGKLDVIVGTAPTAGEAVKLLKQYGLSDSIQIMSYYYSPDVDKGIRENTILAAPTDSTVIMSRIAIDTMVRILEGVSFYKHVAPAVVVIDQDNIKNWDSSNLLPPKGFHPIFSVNE